jgi:hypothetical protein
LATILENIGEDATESVKHITNDEEVSYKQKCQWIMEGLANAHCGNNDTTRVELIRGIEEIAGIDTRRDHILFNLFLTDYQLPTFLFSCIFSSYRHLHYSIIYPRYSASDWGRFIIRAAPLSPPACLSRAPVFLRGLQRRLLRGQLRELLRGQLRAMLLSLLGTILVETLPVACLFFYLR